MEEEEEEEVEVEEVEEEDVEEEDAVGLDGMCDVVGILLFWSRLSKRISVRSSYTIISSLI